MSKAPRISKAQGRSVKEWSSDNPDAMPPDPVRLRILRRFGNKCALTSIIIADGQKFDLDHIVRVEDGGENRESNMQPVLRLPHEVKSAAERKIAAKADRIAKKGHGLTPEPTKKIESAPLPSSKKEPAIVKQPITHMLTAIERRFGVTR
jgi:hypothetical protein